ARVLNVAEGKDIESLLLQINGHSYVEGSLIVGNDGLVIAAQISPELDKAVLGAMSFAIHANTNLIIKKMEMGSLKQIVLQSHQKLTVLTALRQGILGVFTASRKLERLNSLM